MVMEVKAVDYLERLEELDLTTLETRRLKGDLIQIYKIFNGIDRVSLRKDPRKVTKSITRSHNQQITRENFKNCPLRNNFLFNRNATTWNNLPKSVVSSISVNSFKANLDRHIKSNGLLRVTYLP
jgi:ribonuclease P/MRP protein subunit RPP40